MSYYFLWPDDEPDYEDYWETDEYAVWNSYPAYQADEVPHVYEVPSPAVRWYDQAEGHS